MDLSEIYIKEIISEEVEGDYTKVKMKVSNWGHMEEVTRTFKTHSPFAGEGWDNIKKQGYYMG